MTNGGKFDVYFTNFNIANRSRALNAQYRAYFSNIFQVLWKIDLAWINRYLHLRDTLKGKKHYSVNMKSVINIYIFLKIYTVKYIFSWY